MIHVFSTNEDENYILTVNDFNFSDPDDSGSLNQVKITTLETNGNLEYYNGTAWVPLEVNGSGTLKTDVNVTDVAYATTTVTWRYDTFTMEQL